MAAVESPISMLTTPVIPERRPRTSEVIDVDSLDDSYFISHRPRQRRRLSENRDSATSSAVLTPETIIISDSDDDNEPSTRVPTNARSSGGRSHRTGRFSHASPPPPPLDLTLPPVPPLPPQFTALQSLPMRRRPPPFPASNPVPAVVRPIDLPFVFEAPVPSAETTVPPAVAAPPSHHVPTMGFGGALISQHRQNTASEDAARRRRAAEERERERLNDENFGRRFTNLYRSAIRRLSGGPPPRRSRPQPLDHDDIITRFLADVPEIFFSSISNDPTRSRRNVSEYCPLFTHPPKPAPGFTFDFAPPSLSPSPASSSSKSKINVDEPAASSSSSSASEEESTLLACARCLEPLMLGGGSDDGQQRLWGLRCGHLIDGKCAEHIMKPSDPVSVKGKGKATVEMVQNNTSNADKEVVVKEAEPPTTPNSIRSRLRPRHHPSSPQSSEDQSVNHRLPVLSLVDDPRHLLRPARKSKGKSKAKEPPVEGSHEWVCPVAGCDKRHLSLLVGGNWIMDKDRGAIGVYAWFVNS
jgi:hypothetical protein